MLAATEVLGTSVKLEELSGVLKQTSIPEFGRIRQAALELRAKQWFHEGRPKGLPAPF